MRFGRPLVLHIACSAACDVRGQVSRGDGERSLRRAGRGLLRISPSVPLLTSARTRSVPVRLLYGAPGALHPRARTLRVRVREIGVPAVQVARNVRATRLPGDRIRVTWTNHADLFAFVVTGSATRGGEPLAVGAASSGRGGRFAVTLRHVRGIRFVTVSTLSVGVAGLGHPVEVRVRELPSSAMAMNEKPVVEVPSDQPPSYQLELEDIVEGDGDEAVAGRIVEVHYVGVSWKTGNQFDASWDRGDTFKFGLGKGQVIPGWDQGVAGMRVGGRRRITIPPNLAYGKRGAGGVIGPDETLVFVVDLIGVR